MNDFRKMWNDACLSVGIPSLSTDTCARIMAVMYIHGGAREEFTHHEKLVADIKYIQERFDVKGGGTPDEEFARLVRAYSDELEEYIDPRLRFASTPETVTYISLQYRLQNIKEEHKSDLGSVRDEIEAIKARIREMEINDFPKWNPDVIGEQFPEWAEKLFMDLYGIKL